MPFAPPLRGLFIDIGLNYHGGVSQVLLNLARHRHPAQLSMDIGCLEPALPMMIPTLGALGVPVHEFGEDGLLAPARRLRRVLRERQIEIVVATSFRSYLVAKLATLGSRIPVLFWIHTINQLTVSRVKAAVFRRLSRHDTLLHISKAAMVANRPAGHLGRDVVIYNGVEAPESRPEWLPCDPARRAEFGLSQDDIVLGYLATFEPYKDHRTLLDAFDRVAAHIPQARLVLIGQGTLLDDMKAYAANLQSGRHIRFLGPRQDARALLGLMDLYVHVSPEEGFGLAVVEAMLARRPVVAARSYALPELVDHGQTGLLFEARNAADLHEQLVRLLDDPTEARRLAQAGDEACRHRFPPGPFAVQVVSLLREELLARPSSPLPRRPS